MTGVTFADTLADPDAAERHTQQYFENFGNRAMYKDGWWLPMRMPRTPWRLDPELLKRFAPGVWDPDDDPVELYNHSYTITADLHVPDGGAEGVIVADANHLGGFSLFVADGNLKHTYALLGVFEYRQESEGVLPSGDVTVAMAFAADAAKPATPGQVTLFVNGEQVGGGRMDHTVPFSFSGYSGLDVGRDNGLVVNRGYAAKAPFAFTGTVKKVVFDVAPHPDGKDEHARHAHAQQSHTARGINA